MYKKLGFLILILVSIILFTACSSGTGTSSSTESGESAEKSDSGKTYTLKLATASPENSSFTVMTVKPFMERVTELTEGRVEFDFYPASQLGAAHDLLSLTKDGVTDIGYFAPPYFPSEMPLSAYALGMPGLLDSSYVGTMAYSSLLKNEDAPLLERDFLSNGVRPLYVIMLPPYELYTKGDEIKLPEDLKGLRTRASGGITADAIEFAGGNSVSMDTAEMYGAFDRGVLDAIHNYPSSIKTFGVGDLIGYGTTGLGFGSVAVGLMINEDLWQEFPNDIKEAMEIAAEEVMESGSIGHDEEQSEIEQEFMDAGIVIHEVTEEEKAEWQEVYEAFAEDYFETEDEEFLSVYEMFKAEVDKVKEAE